jgi:hypothetical protein
MVILPKAAYRFNKIPIKIPITFFTGIEKSILNYIWKHKCLNSYSNPEQKEQFGDTTLPEFKLYYKNNSN